MDLTIKPLAPELSGDYFDFFENRAFTDDSPYRCYCQIYQMTKDEYHAKYDNVSGSDLGAVSREIAMRQIKTGALRGYLVYADGVSVGWCNANDKANYPAGGGGARFHSPNSNRDMAVVCFLIAPEFRGKGVASALLDKVITDAKINGFTAVEGFPVARGERYEWECSGPVAMYEKAGFVKAAEHADFIVMRKTL